MRHHDPLVTKSLQHGVVWKREVVRKIVVDLFILFFKRTNARSDSRTRMRTRAHVRARRNKTCASTCVCAKLLIFNGDLVMHTRNQLEVVSVFAFVVILQTLLSPRTPIIAIFPIRFRHSLDVPVREELKWTEK